MITSANLRNALRKNKRHDEHANNVDVSNAHEFSHKIKRDKERETIKQ